MKADSLHFRLRRLFLQSQPPPFHHPHPNSPSSLSQKKNPKSDFLRQISLSIEEYQRRRFHNLQLTDLDSESFYQHSLSIGSPVHFPPASIKACSFDQKRPVKKS
ncbi:hypothetical protein Bca4012_088294 [Brassica carinata]